MTQDGIKVLFIMGRGRSGSTILDNILGELDGFFSTGELHNLWWRGLVKGHPCGCGLPVRECKVWSRVLPALDEDERHMVDPWEVAEWQREIVRPRLTRRLLDQTANATSGWDALDSYVALLGRVYEAAAEATGARVVVDSSKRPAHAALLHLVPGITPHFVHLVRDARAVAYSRQRRKIQGDREMRRENAVQSAFAWVDRNLRSEAVRARYPSSRSMLLRYEDFISEPRSSLRSITELLGETMKSTPLVGDGNARLGVNHAVAGNPSRFKHGTVKLHIDDEWLRNQRRADQLAIIAVAWPWLRRYGYPIRLVSAWPGTG